MEEHYEASLVEQEYIVDEKVDLTGLLTHEQHRIKPSTKLTLM